LTWAGFVLVWYFIISLMICLRCNWWTVETILFLACVKVAIALCSIFVCALKTCMLCLFCHEQEKERARVKEKLERYTKEGLVLLIDVLDLHLPRTGKKVKFLLGHNCVRLESQASLTIHCDFSSSHSYEINVSRIV